MYSMQPCTAAQVHYSVLSSKWSRELIRTHSLLATASSSILADYTMFLKQIKLIQQSYQRECNQCNTDDDTIHQNYFFFYHVTTTNSSSIFSIMYTQSRRLAGETLSQEKCCAVATVHDASIETQRIPLTVR